MLICGIPLHCSATVNKFSGVLTISRILNASARGSLHKAIAFSTDVHGFDFAASQLDRAYNFICENRLFDYGNLFNVNIPGDRAKGIKITRQGDRYYQDEFIREQGDMYRQSGGCVYIRRDAPDDDTEAVLEGYISVTPLTVDRTDNIAYEKIKKSGL